MINLAVRLSDALHLFNTVPPRLTLPQISHSPDGRTYIQYTWKPKD